MERQVYSRMAAIEDRHWWFVARRRILDQVLRRCVTLPERAEILEAGCGTGGNLPLLARFGRVHALEPDAEARAFARAKGGFDIREGRLPAGLPYDPESFDLVAAFDVIEHVEDDRGSLEALAGLLRRDGWLLITVPAFPFLWSRHDVEHHHKRRYRRDEMLRRVTAAGLEPVRATYFNALLFPLIAAVRLLRKALGVEDGADDERVPAGPVNRLLETVFGWERHLVGRVPLPLGVSLLVLARKAAP